MNNDTGGRVMEKYYLGDSTFSVSVSELTQDAVGQLNFFSNLLELYLMESSAQESCKKFENLMLQILSRSSLSHGENITEH